MTTPKDQNGNRLVDDETARCIADAVSDVMARWARRAHPTNSDPNNVMVVRRDDLCTLLIACYLADGHLRAHGTCDCRTQGGHDACVFLDRVRLTAIAGAGFSLTTEPPTA